MDCDVVARFANPRIAFCARSMLRPIRKEVLPIDHITSVINEFSFQCDVDYLGRTSHRLEAGIDQHVSVNFARKRWAFYIGRLAKYLNKNQQFPRSYSQEMFSMASISDYHLKVLESVYIKSGQPTLYKRYKWLVDLNVIMLQCYITLVLGCIFQVGFIMFTYTQISFGSI